MKKTKKTKKSPIVEREEPRQYYPQYTNPYVGNGDHCKYCGAKIFIRGQCPRVDQHEDHGGF